MHSASSFEGAEKVNADGPVTWHTNSVPIELQVRISKYRKN